MSPVRGRGTGANIAGAAATRRRNGFVMAGETETPGAAPYLGATPGVLPVSLPDHKATTSSGVVPDTFVPDPDPDPAAASALTSPAASSLVPSLVLSLVLSLRGALAGNAGGLTPAISSRTRMTWQL